MNYFTKIDVLIRMKMRVTNPFRIDLEFLIILNGSINIKINSQIDIKKVRNKISKTCKTFILITSLIKLFLY